MESIALSVWSGGVSLPATLTIPAPGRIRAGLIPLHPASDPSRDQFLFRHLADILPQQGIAVLRFDRRAGVDDNDVPLEIQAQDALAALQTLRARLGIPTLPVGLWGFSQGAWAAPIPASLSTDVVFLVLVASTGVSPARQMRYGTAEQVRRAGYGPDALAELAAMRGLYEDYMRGRAEQAFVQAEVDRLAERPWFPLTWVPRSLPPTGTWDDMDFEPSAIFAAVRCPTLLFYGEDDEWTPVDASIAAWQRAAADAGNTDVSVVRLPGTSHYPTFSGKQDTASISPLYTERMSVWLDSHVSATAAG